ncbi:MAG: S8 family serine peptidase [Saprospiraceae bacterium]|nr:S8 family serine peptidase [Lewinella sp.]
MGLEGLFTKDNKHPLNQSGFEEWIQLPSDISAREDVINKIGSVELGTIVDYVAPVYQYSEAGRVSYMAVLPNTLLISYLDKDPDKASQLEKEILSRYQLSTNKEKSALLRLIGYKLYETPANHSALEIGQALINDYPKRIEVEYEIKPQSCMLGDEQPPDQKYAAKDFGWHIGQIKAIGAWQIIPSDLVNSPIAVLDTGCCNPILNLLPGISLGTLEPSGEPIDICGKKIHGTQCAIIAAGKKYAAERTTGIAAGFPVIPVAFRKVTDLEVTLGILHAAKTGARVINMSFGQGANDGTVLWNKHLINKAIQHAYSKHRVFLCAAAGNSGQAIMAFPASHPLVVAVGATHRQDKRLDISNYGGHAQNGISVVAPGKGINALNTCAYPDENRPLTGTSASSALVAGLAALILAINPDFTPGEVRDFIEVNAEKVRPDVYNYNQKNSNGLWNAEVGYGRIDVFQTIKSVLEK